MFSDVVRFSDKTDMCMKVQMTFCATFLLLPQLCMWYPPIEYKYEWLVACFFLVGPLYSFVVTYWIFETVIINKLWCMMRPFKKNMAVETISNADTHVKVLHNDVKARGDVVKNGGVMTQTTSPCAVEDFMGYVAYVIHMTDHYTKNYNMCELANWSARLVVVMHSKMHVYLCVKVVILVFFYAFFNWHDVKDCVFELLEKLGEQAKVEPERDLDALFVSEQARLECVKRGFCD